jgi:3-ketosteroid 9alpha-monooxygenase subunit A
MNVATQGREVIENVADVAHFGPVHKNGMERFEVQFDGPRATQTTITTGDDRVGNPTRMTTVATYHGPALQVSHMSGVIPAVAINAHVPVDEHSIELRFAVMIHSDQPGRYHARYAQAFIEVITEGYFQDVAIWDHKVWRDRPVLCDGDGPIGELRAWYARFYEPSERREPSER